MKGCMDCENRVRSCMGMGRYFAKGLALESVLWPMHGHAVP